MEASGNKGCETPRLFGEKRLDDRVQLFKCGRAGKRLTVDEEGWSTSESNLGRLLLVCSNESCVLSRLGTCRKPRCIQVESFSQVQGIRSAVWCRGKEGVVEVPETTLVLCAFCSLCQLGGYRSDDGEMLELKTHLFRISRKDLIDDADLMVGLAGMAIVIIVIGARSSPSEAMEAVRSAESGGA